jgi:glycosyltransferase involved in cell wall biosynthesis
VGIVVSPNNPDELAHAITELAEDPQRLQELAVRAFAAGRNYFDQTKVLKKWSRLMNQLAAKT